MCIENTEIKLDGSIKFSFIRTDNFYIKNYGNIVLDQFTPTGRTRNNHFVLENSSLGRSTFIGVKFREYSLTIVQCQLSQIETYGHEIPIEINRRDARMPGYLPDYFMSSIYFNYGFSIQYRELGKTYNNLQIAMQRQGNKVMEYKYYTAFQDALLHSLWYSRTEFPTRLSLSIHKFSSNYGQNWIRPTLLIFFLGLILFYPYFLSSPNYSFAWPNQGDWSLFGTFWGKFGEFIWPTHKFDFLYSKPGGWVLWWIYHSKMCHLYHSNCARGITPKCASHISENVPLI